MNCQLLELESIQEQDQMQILTCMGMYMSSLDHLAMLGYQTMQDTQEQQAMVFHQKYQESGAWTQRTHNRQLQIKGL